MNISQEKTGELTATLKVEIVENDYAEQYDKQIKSQRKQISLPGFRPGKVPMGLVEKKYGIAIKAEEVNKIVSNAINDYLINNNPGILGYPIPNTEMGNQLDFLSQNDFTFYFDFALTPEINLDISENTVVDYYKIKPQDTIIERFIEDIRKRNSNFVEADEIELTDRIEVLLSELDSNGEIVEGGLKNNAFDFLGYLKDEDTKKKFVGLKIGDTLVINPLQDAENIDMAARMLAIEKTVAEYTTADFLVKVEKITRSILPDLNEELYKKAFPADEIVDEEAFRARVIQEASRAYNEESDKIFVQQAIETLIENADFDLPDDFMKKWLYVSNEGKISIQKIEKDYSHYKNSMKYQLFENKIIAKYPDLGVTNEDVKDEIKSYFSMYIPDNDEESFEERDKQLNSIAEKYMDKKEDVNKIHDQIFNNRLLHLFKSNLQVNNIEVTYDELLEILKAKHPQHDHDHDHDHGDDHDHEHHHDHEHEHEENEQ